MVQWRNTASRYGFVAGALHWIIVAGIIAEYVLAEAAEEGETEGVGAAMSMHYSLGVTLLVLALIRLVWRVVELPPASPPAMKRYEALAARTAHILFYGLLFAIPITGWALATVEGHPISVFGLFDLPQLRIGAQLPIEGGTLSEDQLEEAHELLFNVLVGLGVIHVLGALKHYFFDRDDVLRGMLPRRR
jgi:cytochrome b561